ncbi:hypothetical protein D3877_23215 [Azospirillum cavernae]|uniref:ABC transmembrane type-1 domain-containing protein n=1 Tax=Azospirillum cavernae TaxID=2320860 RepID=A0A418VP80_9PROT|nr:hypothetical protein D3877_23215 [Azospirillum cavernae]
MLRRGPGRFEAVEADGRRHAVTAPYAAGLARDGIALYRPLPARPLSPRDILTAAFTGSGRDVGVAVLLTVTMVLLGLLTPVATGILVNEAVPFAETLGIVHMALGLAAIAVGGAMFALVRSLLLLRFEGRADPASGRHLGPAAAAAATFFRRFHTGDLLMRALAPTQLRRVVADTLLSAGLRRVLAGQFRADADLRRPAGGPHWVALVATLLLTATGLVQLRYERRSVERSRNLVGAARPADRAADHPGERGGTGCSPLAAPVSAQRREGYRVGLAGPRSRC